MMQVDSTIDTKHTKVSMIPNLWHMSHGGSKSMLYGFEMIGDFSALNKSGAILAIGRGGCETTL